MLIYNWVDPIGLKLKFSLFYIVFYITKERFSTCTPTILHLWRRSGNLHSTSFDRYTLIFHAKGLYTSHTLIVSIFYSTDHVTSSVIQNTWFHVARTFGGTVNTMITGLDLVTATFLMISDLLWLQPVTLGPTLPITKLLMSTDLCHYIENPPLRQVSVRDWIIPGTCSFSIIL